jgi:hypothetical protein
MCRSTLRLLASLGLRRILGETSSLYQSGHASQSRPKRKRKMSTMVKATPCFLVSKDCRRRRPTAPLGSLALAVGTPYIQATLTILCTNQAVLDEWTRERVIPKFRSWQGRQASRRVPSGSPTVNYRQLRAKPCVTRRQSGRLAFERFQQGNEAMSMFGRRSRSQPGTRSRRESTPAPNVGGGLPEIPSLEGYTIQELRIEELAHLIRFDELRPEQVTNLIRAFTRTNRSG